MQVEELSAVRAYKRSLALSNSTWYKGILFSHMAGNTDNLAESLMHSLLRLSRFTTSHSWFLADFLDAVNKISAPAQQMDVPTGPDTVTYANADLTDTIKLFEHYGFRLLTANEIRTAMPEYPH